MLAMHRNSDIVIAKYIEELCWENVKRTKTVHRQALHKLS